MGKPIRRVEILLHPQMTLEDFEKWGIDFIEPIGHPSKKKNHILVYIDYLKKWVEVKALILENKELVEKFLTRHIFNRFGVPRKLVTNKGAQFTLKLI